MSFTILFALLALFVLFIVFVVLYRWKGLKVAVIVTAVASVIFAGTLLATIGVIVNSMPN